MEYKRSSHVEEEGEEDDLDEDEEDEGEGNKGHRYIAAPAAPVGAPRQQQTTPPPPGFLQPHRQTQAHNPRRPAERGGGAQHQLRRQQEPARNNGTTASTLALATVGAEPPAQWIYRECLRNHAARLGAHVLDGCCEFMPSASEGAGALACAACDCHRSFHRREAIPVVVAAAGVSLSATTPNANSSRVVPLLLAPPHMQQTRTRVPPASPSSAPTALTESSSEELRGAAPVQPHPPAPMTHQLAVGGSASAPPAAPIKKRFRTKFTAEQKGRMREFADRVGWRIHQPDSDAVDSFCAQLGVSRRVLKVWMHNNKHLAKMPPQSPSSQQQVPMPPHHNHRYPQQPPQPQQHNA